MLRIYRGLVFRNQKFVKGVLYVRRSALRVKQPLEIGFIFGEEQFRLPLANQPAFAVLPMLQFGTFSARNVIRLADDRPARIFAPRPGVAKPQRGQYVQRRRLGAAVGHGNLDQDVFDVRFGVLREYVKIAVLEKNSGIHQFILGILPRTPVVLIDQLLVGIGGLRIFIKRAQVAVRRRRIEIEVTFFDVFAVIALIAGQAKEPLFKD